MCRALQSERGIATSCILLVHWNNTKPLKYLCQGIYGVLGSTIEVQQGFRLRKS